MKNSRIYEKSLFYRFPYFRKSRRFSRIYRNTGIRKFYKIDAWMSGVQGHTVLVLYIIHFFVVIIFITDKYYVRFKCHKR